MCYALSKQVRKNPGRVVEAQSNSLGKEGFHLHISPLAVGTANHRAYSVTKVPISAAERAYKIDREFL
jgi:hypothetical protein